jgi:hypothetical protein
VAASDIFAPDILSTAVKATIAALLSTGEVFYEQKNRGASGNSAVPTDNAAATTVVPKATASATLGQNPGWVTNALAGAETTLKKVGPDAIGFNDRTRELVVSVEAALGGPDPVGAAQITERIVAAQVTPVEDDEVPDGKEQSVDDFLASLGGM